MEISKLITWDRLEDACKRSIFGMDNPGFCISCGDEVEGVEPDAREYECCACGAHLVYGAEELMLQYF